MAAVTSLTITRPSGTLLQGDTMTLTGVGHHADSTTEVLAAPAVRGAVGLVYTNARDKDVDGYAANAFYAGYPGGSVHNLGTAPYPLGPDSHTVLGIRTAEFRLSWSTFNPSEGVYNWLLLDAVMGRVKAKGRRAILCIMAGDSTPGWTTTASTHPVTPYAVDFVSAAGSGAVQHLHLPNPIDANFLYHWTAFIDALGAHCAAMDFTQLIDQVKVQGFDFNSEEMRFATGTGQKVDGSGNPETNDYLMWNAVAYTPNKMLAAWSQIVAAYARNFPGIQLANALIFPTTFPTYGGTSAFHVIEDPSQILTGGQATTGLTSTMQLDLLVAQTMTQIGQARYALNWNSLKGSTTSTTNLLQQYAAGGTKVGYQIDSTSFLSPNCPVILGPTPYGDIRTGSTAQQSACAPLTFYSNGATPKGVLDTAKTWGTKIGGLNVGAEWVECWINTCLAYNTEALAGDALLRARFNEVRWSSSNSFIVAVSNTGVATGVGVGTATITAYHVASGLSTTTTITVPYELRIDVPNPLMNLDSTQQLTAVGSPAAGTEVDLINLDIRRAFGIVYTHEATFDFNGYPPDYFYPGYPGNSPHANSTLVPSYGNGPPGPDVHTMPAACKTVMLKIGWKDIQTGPTTYDWRFLDTAMGRVLAAGKRLIFSASAGDDTPSWVTTHPTLPVPLYDFYFVPGGGVPLHARLIRLPDNRNPNYLTLYTTFTQAVADHCAEMGYTQFIDQVKVGGFQYSTEEMRIPASDGTSQAQDGANSSNDLAFWTTMGYTPTSMMAAWQVIVDAYDAAWPDTQMSMPVVPVGAVGGMPKYGGTAPTIALNLTGVGGWPADPVAQTGNAQYDALLAYAASKFGSRMAANWNAIKGTTSGASQLLTAYANLGYRIGYQLDESQMGSPQCPVITGTPVGGPPYGNISTPSHGGTPACAPTLLYNYGVSPIGAIDRALLNGSKDLATGQMTGCDWLEVFQNDVVAYPQELLDGDVAIRAGDDSVRWTSSDLTIATVSPSGLVTSVAPGAVSISAFHVGSGVTRSAAITVEADASDYVTTIGMVIDLRTSYGAEERPTVGTGTANTDNATNIAIGVKFSVAVDGRITKVRYYRRSTTTATVNLRIFQNTGALSDIVAGPFTDSQGAGTNGYQTFTLPTPLDVAAGEVFTVSLAAPITSFHYPGTETVTDSANIHVIDATLSSALAGGCPTSPNSACIYLEPVFQPSS